VFPNKFNQDHEWTFKFFKVGSWSPRSLKVLDLIRNLCPEADPVKIELLASTYRFGLPRNGQTRRLAECGIEFMIRKCATSETGGERLGAHERAARPRDAAAPEPAPRRSAHAQAQQRRRTAVYRQRAPLGQAPR